MALAQAQAQAQDQAQCWSVESPAALACSWPHYPADRPVCRRWEWQPLCVDRILLRRLQGVYRNAWPF